MANCTCTTLGANQCKNIKCLCSWDIHRPCMHMLNQCIYHKDQNDAAPRHHDDILYPKVGGPSRRLDSGYICETTAGLDACIRRCNVIVLPSADILPNIIFTQQAPGYAEGTHKSAFWCIIHRYKYVSCVKCWNADYTKELSKGTIRKSSSRAARSMP